MLRAVIALLMLLVPSIAHAEKRLALLIGNEAYPPAIGALANPHNDVAILETAVKSLGFEVDVVRDVGLGAMTRAVNAYARRVQAAGPDAIGFFYYSGHGAADGNTNYLIPVDVKTTETGELWDQSLRLTTITRQLKSEAGNATHFVVFDACRNALKLTQPGSRAMVQAKGFVPVAQENGMLIAYATAEGELATDVGTGAGPYAKALAEEIVKPGIEAVVMFRAVQRRVRATIYQEPYLGFNTLGDVYLAGKSQGPNPVASEEMARLQEQLAKMEIELKRQQLSGAGTAKEIATLKEELSKSRAELKRREEEQTEQRPPKLKEPAAATSTSGAGFVAVLASKKSRMDALKALAELQEKYPEVLGAKTPDVQEADLGDNGVWYRAVAGPPGSREAATSVCSQLKTAGHPGCWVAAY